MSDLDDFLTPTLARQLEAEQALCNGDPGPRLAMWSTRHPVTVLGAMKTVIGPEETRQAFHWLATRFSNLTDYRFELVAAGASGDLPTPSATNTPPSPWTASRSSRSPCASPNRAARFLRRIDGVSVPARDQGRAGATSGPHPTRTSGTTPVTSGRATSSSAVQSPTQPGRFRLGESSAEEAERGL